MTADGAPDREDRSDDGFDRGYEGHFRRQVRRGLRLTYAERLRWLERTMDEMRRIVGRARSAR